MDENNNAINEPTEKPPIESDIGSWAFLVGVFTILGGIIGGIVVGQNTGYYGDMNWGMFFAIAVSAIIIGTLLIALAEIINILSDIRNKQL